MAMPATLPPERWTRAMFDALPDDGKRHEIIDGVHYVNPSPGGAHQLVVGELYAVLHAFIKREPVVGWVLLAPFDIDLGDDTVVEPDIVVMPKAGQRLPEAGAPGVVPILAIEVISPSSGSRDRILKRRRYQRAGIEEYWIVDPVSRLVERWRPDDERPEIITDSLHWSPSAASTELVIDVASIFTDISSSPA